MQYNTKREKEQEGGRMGQTQKYKAQHHLPAFIYEHYGCQFNALITWDSLM